MKNSIILLLILINFFKLYSQDSKPEAYTIFDSTGKKVSYEEVLSFLSKNEVVLFGESHNNPISHWLELRILKDLHQSYKITVGLEMLESDDQLVLDEYLNSIIREKDFKKEAKMWNNYDTDYSPIINFCKSNSLPVIATNIPRRFASLVAREGQDSLLKLPTKSRSFICPLPFEFDSTLIGYKSMMSMGAGHGMAYIAESQAIKDATMASFIAENLPENGIFYHLNGSYHSKEYQGINWYLKRFVKDIKIANVITLESEDINQIGEEEKKLADYIIVITSDMTKTY